jgi:large subunit ribosomal protein L4
MAVVDILNTTGEKISQTELNDEVFNVAVKPGILHEVVNAQLAGRRKGTASVKRRSDVRGSGKKLYRQKGTGRARKGNIKSPILRGGGVAFGPEQRSYAQRTPKKVKRLALKMALSSKLQGEDLMVLNDFELEDIKTKRVVKIVKELDIANALIVTSGENRNLELSARNVPGLKVLKTEGLNVYDILRHDKLVITEASIEGIEGRLLK